MPLRPVPTSPRGKVIIPIDPEFAVFYIAKHADISGLSASLKRYMALQVGSQAPHFSLSYKDSQGIHLATLSDNFGQKNTLLLFFPMAFTGVCTNEMCEISDAFSIYEDLQTKVYGISGDSPFSLEAWALKEQISVTLLSDYDHSVAKAYDILYEIFAPQINLPLKGVAKRSAFIVDRNGKIQYVESSENSKQLPNFKAIRAQLQELA